MGPILGLTVLADSNSMTPETTERDSSAGCVGPWLLGRYSMDGKANVFDFLALRRADWKQATYQKQTQKFFWGFHFLNKNHSQSTTFQSSVSPIVSLKTLHASQAIQPLASPIVTLTALHASMIRFLGPSSSESGPVQNHTPRNVINEKKNRKSQKQFLNYFTFTLNFSPTLALGPI